jgi:D-proline reductase (dithiol) PrdB
VKKLSLSRLKNQAIAKVTTRLPSLARRISETFSPLEMETAPWTPPGKPLSECKVALVTTAGVHHRDQTPFNMRDREGDPSFRVIDLSRRVSDLTITHDYYDHSDADQDINIVFPTERLQELEREGIIGHVARFHYGFMGHILGRHIETLVNESAPEVARKLNADAIDVVLLTPG